MKRSRLVVGSLLVVAIVSSVVLVRAAGTKNADKPQRDKAVKKMQEGNWKEAYDMFSKLALDSTDEPKEVSGDLTNAIQCLHNLGRLNEIDDFREKVIAAHAGNWRLLLAAAQSYLSGEHYGYIVAGKFNRGYQRGGAARYVNSYERDRVRALQLMQQAMDKTRGEEDRAAIGEFYLQFANVLLGNRGWYEAWRLQYLSDLSVLPDYEEGYYYGGGSGRGAPVNPDGTPVYHYTPKSWKEAKSDGERWRWCLLQAMEYAPARANEVRYLFADFLCHQFGVQTMMEYRWYFGRTDSDDDTRKNEAGTFELHTLSEEETIAKLATGIKRFKLPDEFNFIKILQQVGAEAKDHWGHDSLCRLGQVFEDRRQYDKAADYWKKAGEKERVNQILNNWGQFEPIMTQPAGQGASVEYRFRNGTKVSFEAHEIDIKKLLDDVKAYIKSGPKQLDWEKMDISNIGYRLVEKNQRQYLVKQVAAWDLDLKPRPMHFDKRITVATPLQKAGAYLLVAKMDNGNVSRIVIWVADTAIVKKMLDKQAYYYVADAVSGQPVAKANLEFFGYRQEWVEDKPNRGGKYVVHTRNFAEFTDADGQCMPKPSDQEQNHQWIVTATTPEGRLAYLGFTNVWYGNWYDAEYNAVKTFVITDRPVYRPKQPVKFKFWVNNAKYDQEGKSAFAGKTFNVRINDPKGEKVFEKAGFKADDYGGFDGEWEIPKDATLGVYHVFITNQPGGGGNFRVEEYKKPEFEVKVEAPKEPVMLGEKIAAKITAKYYFGAPVTEAKVKYKVLRTSYSAHWYPVCYWDWFYGPGYWWYAYDYNWYPGWKEWGCLRPIPWWWWNWHPREQPEIVAEAEVPIGKDGEFSVEIDTSVAKTIHGDTDHKYEITAEVTDQSRRTIVGQGSVLVARKPFKVYAWVDRGHYRVGDVIHSYFNAHTLDNKPIIKGKGELRLLKITYDKDYKPVENEVQKWALDTNEEGCSQQQIKASEAGQYRLSYKLTDSKNHTLEGGYVFCIIGEGFDGSQFRFNDVELVADKQQYQPGEKVKLMVNTNRAGAAVLLFLRPTNGIYLAPKVLRLKGKSAVEEIEVVKRDMPNFFVEALTVSGGKVYSEMREIVVPPEKRVLNVEVKPVPGQAGAPAAGETPVPRYKPGEKAKVKVKLTDPTGEPYSGSTVVAIYDKAVEYISGGSNVPEIKEFFWKWRRHHQPRTETSLDKGGWNIIRSNEIAMAFLGVFGHLVANEPHEALQTGDRGGGGTFGAEGLANGAALPTAAPGALRQSKSAEKGEAQAGGKDEAGSDKAPGGAEPPPLVQPTVRTKFADTALWVASLTTGKDGTAEVDLTMPENLTTWKCRVWAMGEGTKVGEGTADMITTKNLLIRLQAPRFFVQKDEVVLSANVHNYLKGNKKVQVSLELDGPCLLPDGKVNVGDTPKGPIFAANQQIEVPANGEKRVDWRVKVLQPGEATIRMKALTDEESDAMEMKFPVFVHGMLKMESFCGVIRPDKETASVTVKVPAERKPEQSRLEIRYSPTLAGAMVDALPYMVDYPYGCTEQTLNRFLPTVITQKVLMRMGLDLKAIKEKQTNLNAQEIGEDKERAKDWGYHGGYMSRGTAKYQNPVYDEEAVKDMVKAGLERLTSMQCSDGGWGWFSGWGEHSWPHTTAVVVHGMQIARDNDVALVPGVLERGVAWLKRYQAEQVQWIKNAPRKIHPWKEHADDLDALVYMVLVDEAACGKKAGDKVEDNQEMRDFLYRDRNFLAVYSKAMFGIALHRIGDKEKRDMLIRNVEQYLVQDDENQTAYLRLENQGYWWYWYGSEYEAHAYYLKLLAATDPKSEKASRLVKYLINNRKNASYWNSTRDTSVVIEAFADYIKASGEDKPDMTVTILIDGKQAKEVKIDKTNLFMYDNKFVLTGEQVTTGEHKVEFRKKGTGPLYFNAYLTNFTLEDPITKAGLEVKVNRKYYKLTEVDKKIKVEGVSGQAVDQKVQKYERQELANLATVKSGDLVEIELEIDSKNDYEYLMFEDMKAAGFEPVDLRSGYNNNDMGAYMELRDERVTFFVRMLARGKHSVSYRMRAEIPGKFSALPTKASAMYAPELKANSDEIKMVIQD